MKFYKEGENYFYNDPWKVHLLEEECISWLGTPYAHWTGVKGRGADCIHYVVKVNEAIGANGTRHAAIPKYTPDWHMHHRTMSLREGIEKQYNLTRLFTPESIRDFEMSQLRDGDIILFQYGLHPAHAAIYLKGLLYQSLTGLGVEYRSADDPEFRSRMRYGYRYKVVGT